MKRTWLLSACLMLALWLGDSFSVPGAPDTHRRPMEQHHSFHPPFDQASPYWKYGGDAIMTSKSAVIVPPYQSRMGYMYNDYPLERKNWESEILVEVSSHRSLGGDGFTVACISGAMDPASQSQTSSDTLVNSFSGPIFGLREDFKGFAVVFDTYDNDGRRDNPSVFVIQNSDGKFKFNNDNDYADNYIRSTSSNLPCKCTADYRNLGKPFKVLLRYLDNVLHVYVDDSVKEVGYKFCLAVNVDIDADMEKHLAITAMTGELADAVKVASITTRYLDESDSTISDEMLEHSEKIGGSKWRQTYWFLVTCTGLFLFGWTVRDIIQLSSFQKTHVNPVYICNELNSWMLTHFCIHFGLCGLLAIGGQFTGLLLNFPLAAYRVFSIWQKNYTLDPAILSGGSHKGHSKPKLSYTTRLYITAFFYLIPLFFYCYRLFI
uniref:L-type lectin-like domain-containing protein n=1 Tax=Spongospora subterranea TaxID=70186 RepID=A0A0H5R5T1_9EUKA|eukprot:CRZ09142.1 hypothetical protein [Spongospora subterranea]